MTGSYLPGCTFFPSLPSVFTWRERTKIVPLPPKIVPKITWTDAFPQISQSKVIAGAASTCITFDSLWFVCRFCCCPTELFSWFHSTKASWRNHGWRLWLRSTRSGWATPKYYLFSSVSFPRRETRFYFFHWSACRHLLIGMECNP